MKSTLDPYFTSLLAENRWVNYTPDRAELRYFGDLLPVFIWDGNKEYTEYRKLFSNLTTGVDYQTEYPTAYTANSYVPLLNQSNSQNSFRQYMFGNNDNLPMLFRDKVKPKPVVGKVFRMSLEGIETLDNEYQNGYNFRRIRAPIKVKQYPMKTLTCFMYVNDASQVVKLNPHEKKYEYAYPGMELVAAVESRDGKAYEVV